VRPAGDYGGMSEGPRAPGSLPSSSIFSASSTHPIGNQALAEYGKLCGLMALSRCQEVQIRSPVQIGLWAGSGFRRPPDAASQSYNPPNRRCRRLYSSSAS